MPQKGDVHIVPREGRWAVEVEGATAATSLHDTQQEAIAAGRRLARGTEHEILVHGRDGRIRDRDTHGHDPRDVPG